jgi:oligopeptide/dipeptide ABC transporter ATP-binding protein
LELFRQVGLADAERVFRSYPHELSGGMCQRVMIAMALAPKPALVVADEPTTALDVTVQAQILDLLVQLRDEQGLSILLITHDMGVASVVADRVVVVYAGRTVEQQRVGELFANPLHPYTMGLLGSLPRMADSSNKHLRLTAIPGMVPEPGNLPVGCAFQARCSQAIDLCKHEDPPLVRSASRAQVACWVASDGA